MHLAAALFGLAAVSGIAQAAPSVNCAKHNRGLQYAIYDNISPLDTANNYEGFDPTVYKTIVPKYGNYTTHIVNRKQAKNQLLKAGHQGLGRFVLNYRGYFVPALSGTYTITMSKTDDVMFFWHGATAYSGWTHNNADLIGDYADEGSSTNGHVSTTITLTAGQFTPFRIMYGEYDPPFSFNFAITDPNGKVVLSKNPQHNNGRVVRFGCQASNNAPKFPLFGQET